MRVVEHSSASVETTLSELETAYGSFPVNQTTVTLATERYERVRAASGQGCIDLYAIVRNDEGEILHVDRESGHVLPGVSVGEGSSLEPRLRSSVRNRTGIECRIANITEARIVGIRDRSRNDTDPVYRLAIVFDAEYRTGATTESACWLDDIQGLPVRVPDQE